MILALPMRVTTAPTRRRALFSGLSPLLALIPLHACITPDEREGPTLSVDWGESEIDPDDSFEKTTTRVGVGYGFGERTRWAVTPALHLTVGNDDSVFLNGELRKHLWLRGNWVLTPSTGAGYFDDGDTLELGHDLEFRSGVELSYRFPGGSRLGVGFYHISNAGLGDDNPGANETLISWTLPMP